MAAGAINEIPGPFDRREGYGQDRNLEAIRRVSIDELGEERRCEQQKFGVAHADEKSIPKQIRGGDRRLPDLGRLRDRSASA